MKSEEILNEDLNDNKFSFSEKSGRIIIYSILIVLIVNAIVSFIRPVPDHVITNLDGSIVTDDEIIRNRFPFLLYGLPLISLVLASIFSFIPYKKLRYKEKYKRFALITILVFYSLALISSILKF